jgi:hypothetical protein
MPLHMLMGSRPIPQPPREVVQRLQHGGLTGVDLL